MELIKKLDASGVGISLTLNKLTHSKTLIGGCLTIMMYLFLILMFYLSIQDVVQRENPKINIVEELNENAELLMSNSTLPIWFFLNDNANDKSINKPEYFSYSFISYKANAKDPISKKFNIIKCNPQNYKINGIRVTSGSNCIEDQNFTLIRSSIESFYADLVISFCENKTDSKITCAPKEEILNYIKKTDISLEMRFMTTIINTKNLENPIQNYIYYYPSIRLQNDFKLLTRSYFSLLSVKSNDNPLFDTNNLYESKYFDRSELKEYYSPNDFSVIFSFRCSAKKLDVTRRYTKIQEVLASIGGLSNVLNIALKLTCLIFSTMSRDEILINEIFDFEMKNYKSNMTQVPKEKVKNINVYLPQDPHKPHDSSKPHDPEKPQDLHQLQDPHKPQDPHKLQEPKDPHNPIDLSFNSNSDKSKISSPSANRGIKKKKQFKKADTARIELSQINMIKDPKQVIDILEKRKKKFTLRFSSWEIIKAYFCCKCVRSKHLEDKMKLYNKSKNLILNFMDITHILKKLEEFEKLKIVIFSSEQLALFNFISKEYIYLNEEDIQNHILTRMKTFASNKNELANLIVNFKSKITSNEVKIKQIDKKLNDLLIDDLK